MQKNFDDFKAELLTNEARLQQMNETASKLMSSGHTEAALKIQSQIEVSNVFNENYQQNLLSKLKYDLSYF